MTRKYTREQKKMLKFLQQQGRLMDLTLCDLMIQELKFDGKLRRKALRMAKKREVDYVS